MNEVDAQIRYYQIRAVTDPVKRLELLGPFLRALALNVGLVRAGAGRSPGVQYEDVWESADRLRRDTEGPACTARVRALLA